MRYRVLLFSGAYALYKDKISRIRNRCFSAVITNEPPHFLRNTQKNYRENPKCLLHQRRYRNPVTDAKAREIR